MPRAKELAQDLEFEGDDEKIEAPDSPEAEVEAASGPKTVKIVVGIGADGSSDPVKVRDPDSPISKQVTIVRQQEIEVDERILDTLRSIKKRVHDAQFDKEGRILGYKTRDLELVPFYIVSD